MATKCGHDIEYSMDLFFVLLGENGMLGKNAIAGGGQSLAADVAALITVYIGVRICCIGTYVSTAVYATSGAIVGEGVEDLIHRRAAVLALCRARIETFVTALGILGTADGAGLGASVLIGVSKAGSLAADVADTATLISRRNVCSSFGSLFAAEITFGIASTVIGVSNGLCDLKGLAAVTADRTANGNCLVIYISVTGGAALNVTGRIALEGVGVSRYGLAAAFNLTDTVAIKRIIIEANVIANSKTLFAVADVVGISVNVIDHLGSAASFALQCVASALPNVLLFSFIAAAVVTGLVASVAVCVLVIVSYEAAGKASAAASELKAVQVGRNGSRSAAVNALDGALKLVYMLCCAGHVTVGALGGAGMKPCMLKALCGTDLFTNVALCIASVRVGVDNVISLRAAKGAGSGALGSISMRQIGANRAANLTFGSTAVFILVSERLKRSLANGANGALTALASVLLRGCSFHGLGATITERIARGAVHMALGAETTRKRNERQGYG